MTPPQIKSRISRILSLTAALALSASPATATWSILITDTRTGEFVLGSATCLTTIDLARETPLVLTGIGAITAQSVGDSTGRNRMYIRDRLLERQPLSQILDDLALQDPGHNNRQYGMITTQGDTLTYSGIQNANWAGGITGRIEQGRPGPLDDIVYAVQGNILSGPNVVDAAVNAIINTNTDLPGKLMASMLAARQAGGDGRCSCTTGAPTDCGSPPPAPFKSAHVGYMIASRADDTDSIRAFYDLPANATATTMLDDNLIAVATTDGLIELYTNATTPGDQVAHFNKLTTLDPNIQNETNIYNLFPADLDNNGLNDLVIVNDNSRVVAFFQLAPGTFSKSATTLSGFNIQTVIPYDIPNYPGTQLIFFGTPPWSSYVLRVNEDRTVSTVDSFTPAFVADAVTTDINNDNIPDLFYVSSSFTQVHYHIGRADGRITNHTITLPTSDFPRKLRVADINNDGLSDILVATVSSNMIDVFLNTGSPNSPAFSNRISSPINGWIVDFDIADFNNDNIPDIAALTSNSRSYQLLAGNAKGNFSQIATTRLGTPTNLILTDLNNDGDKDLVVASGSTLYILDNQQDGTIPRRQFFARGNKFMFFNIRNQTTASIDPVDQMLTMFNDFRLTLANKIDAVQTTVSIPTRVLIDNQSPHASSPTIRIELRDWQSSPLTAPATFDLQYNPANLTVGPPTLIEPGIYELTLTAQSSNGAIPGRHPLKIKATINDHSVTLMPTPTIPTTNLIADFNADSILSFVDVSAFVYALTNQIPTADLNADTLFNSDDILIFINAFQSP